MAAYRDGSGTALPAMRQERPDFQRPAGLRRDQEERAVEIDCGDGRRVGRVQDHQVLGIRRGPQHLWSERGTAHAEQHDPGTLDRLRPPAQLLGFAAHPGGDVEPAKAGGGDVPFGPQRRVATVQPLEQGRHQRASRSAIEFALSVRA